MSTQELLYTPTKNSAGGREKIGFHLCFQLKFKASISAQVIQQPWIETLH